jgi:hypothetical protein
MRNGPRSAICQQQYWIRKQFRDSVKEIGRLRNSIAALLSLHLVNQSILSTISFLNNPGRSGNDMDNGQEIIKFRPVAVANF